MHSEWPLSRDLVLIGGGHTHALVLRKWGMNPLTGARVTLINPGPSAPYTGMLPGHIAGHYTRADLDIDLVRLARFAGARIIFDKAIGLDSQTRHVHLEGRAPLRYDIASIDIGVTAEMPDVQGFSEHAISVKPLGLFASAWETFLSKATAPSERADCLVIGGGVAGVEVALAMSHRLRQLGLTKASITLLEIKPDILSGSGKRARKTLLNALSGSGITLRTSAQPCAFSPDGVHLPDGEVLAADFIVSTAGARAYDWVAETGLPCTNGFINVGPDLRTISHPDIFAVGDCAHLVHAPRPKAGVFAVRQAPVLFDNIRAALSGGSYRKYHPQSDFLKLISLGGKSAIAQKHGLTLSGPWFWKLKDHIDTAFMDHLRDLPAMPLPPAPASRALDEETESREAVLCGGCGSKVGRESLNAALASLPPPTRPDVICARGDDAAILQIGDRHQVISTDHLRAFTEDPYLFARIAAIHALGDIWAMGATPQSAVLTLIIPRMIEPMQAATVSEMVTAASDVLRNAGADLVGGHTSIGSELTAGLTVTGLLDRPAIGLSGALAGDVLILTKPLGTGVILAAEMRRRAHGEDVTHALSSMQRPLGIAAAILAPAARAMTDVTGFGLAGHLMGILEASGVAARIHLERLPFLPGAEELTRQGIRSSIWHANARLDTHVERPDTPASDLIYDPQTAGGLLAAVPADRAPNILKALTDAGEPAFLIGEIKDGVPHIIVS